MKYLITGGAGFIGSYLASSLLRDGHQVHVFDNLSTGEPENIQSLSEYKGFRSTIADIRDYHAVEQAVSECDQVIHLAASVGVKKVMEQAVETLMTNVMGTEYVLRLAAIYRKKVFLASSSEVYGKVQGNKGLLSEDDDGRLGPTSGKRWGYACSKAMDEFLAFAYHQERELPVVIGRFFNVVGAVQSPRQKGEYGKVLPRFIDRAVNGKPLLVYGDGAQVRSFTHISDVVRAIRLLMDTPAAVGEVFNIGNHSEISIQKLAEKIIRLTGSRSQIKNVPHEEVYGIGFEDIDRRTPDLTKIQNTIDYEPQFSINEILNEVIAEYYRGDDTMGRAVGNN